MSRVYALTTNNGQQYEDYTEFFIGVFSDKENTIKLGIEDSNKMGTDVFYVDECEIDGECLGHCYIKDKDGNWSTRE